MTILYKKSIDFTLTREMAEEGSDYTPIFKNILDRYIEEDFLKEKLMNKFRLIKDIDTQHAEVMKLVNSDEINIMKQLISFLEEEKTDKQTPKLRRGLERGPFSSAGDEGE